MKVIEQLQQVVSQAEFGQWVGISEARVSQLMSEGVLARGETGHQWLVAYCQRMRDIAAGRASSEAGGLDLVQERAALAREQRHGIALKNAVARGEYAPISLLAEVLATASQSVSERFEQMPGMLRKVCPELPDAARDQLMSAIADARNEWVRATRRLVVEEVTVPDEDEEGDSE